VSYDVEAPFIGPTLFDIELLIVCGDGPQDGVYFLREHGGRRRFSSTMDYCQTAALYWSLQPSGASRRATHAVFANSISALGATVQDVVIYGASETDGAFRAMLRMQQSGGLVEVDVRPSDALNLAVACSVPILVSENAWRTYIGRAHRSH